MSYEGSIVVRQVEAKQTAMLFKQQLQAFVETFYGMVRDNLRRELTSLLSLAIQVCLDSMFILRILKKSPSFNRFFSMDAQTIFNIFILLIC